MNLARLKIPEDTFSRDVAHFFVDPMAMCESEVNKTSGWIAPVQHEYITTKNMDCHYILRVEAGHVVHLEPFTLYISETAFCLSEFVEVYIETMIIQPQHDKTNRMIFAPSKDSNQHGHPPSLISLLCPHEETFPP